MKNSDNLSIHSIRKKILLMSKVIGTVLVISYILSTKLPFSSDISLSIWTVFVVLLIFAVDFLMSCFISKPISVFDKGIITRHLKNGANLHQTTPDRRYWGKLKAAVFARYGRSPLGAALFWLSRRPPADPGHSIRKV